MFCMLSVPNASLHLSSRTLYGLTYKLGGSGIKAYINERTGVVLPKTGAPAMAILVSLMAWYRLVFLDIPRDNGLIFKI